METKTELLSDITMDISQSAKVADLHVLLAAKLGWPATAGLERSSPFWQNILEVSRPSSYPILARVALSLLEGLDFRYVKTI